MPFAGSKPLADAYGSGSDGLPIGSQPLAQAKKKRTRGGRIERCRKEAKLRAAARKADEVGSTTAHERFSHTATTYAEAARRATDTNAEGHRADIAHRTPAQAVTGLPGATQVDAEKKLQHHDERSLWLSE